MVASMLRRFVVSAVLTVPIVVFSPIGGTLGLPSEPPFGLSMGSFGLILATPVVLWGGWPFISSAARSLRHGEVTMMTLIAEAMLRVVADGRNRGLEWWTSEEIAAWERLRRAVSPALRSVSEGHCQLEVETPRPISGFGVAVVLPGAVDRAVIATSAAGSIATRAVVCHNQPAHLLQWDLVGGTSTIEIRW